MPAKKPPTPRTKREPRPPHDRPEHRFAVILEDVHSRLAGLAEGLIMARESLARQMHAGFTDQGGRIGRLEAAILAHSGEIRGLAIQVAAVESKLDTKADTSRVDALAALHWPQSSESG